MQYALVSGDSLVTERNGAPVITGHVPECPKDFASHHPSGSQWVRVENTDERLFDKDRHYRLKPVFRVDGKRVLRVHPIIEREAV